MYSYHCRIREPSYTSLHYYSGTPYHRKREGLGELANQELTIYSTAAWKGANLRHRPMRESNAFIAAFRKGTSPATGAMRQGPVLFELSAPRVTTAAGLAGQAMDEDVSWPFGLYERSEPMVQHIAKAHCVGPGQVSVKFQSLEMRFRSTSLERDYGQG